MLLPWKRVFSAGIVSSYALALDKSTFTPGLRYTFQLRISYDDFKDTPDAFAEINLMMNEAPSGGVLAVVPGSGEALTKVFSIRTYSWVDDPEDYPISFVISFYTSDKSKANIVKPFSTVAYVNTVLGQGLPGTNMVTCFVTAYDIYNGAANAYQDVKVTKPTSTKNVTDAMKRQLQSAVSNPDMVTQVVGTVTLSLNVADCAKTTVEKCDAANRNGCFDISNTCGECKPGYTGIKGPSNAPCVGPAKNPRRRLQHRELLWGLPSSREDVLAIKTGTPGSVCASSAACFSGLCKKGICTEAFKRCPNDCSNNGICRYLDIDDNVVPVCLLQDPFCRAECACFPPRFISAQIGWKLRSFFPAALNSLLVKKCTSYLIHFFD